MTAVHPARRADWLLAIAVLASPLAWAGQLAAGWALSEMGCAAGIGGELFGVGVATWEVAVSSLAFATALIGVWAGVRWRRSSDASDDARGERRRTAARVGLGTSVLFAVLVAFGAVQLVALETCR